MSLTNKCMLLRLFNRRYNIVKETQVRSDPVQNITHQCSLVLSLNHIYSPAIRPFMLQHISLLKYIMKKRLLLKAGTRNLFLEIKLLYGFIIKEIERISQTSIVF